MFDDLGLLPEQERKGALMRASSAKLRLSWKDVEVLLARSCELEGARWYAAERNEEEDEAGRGEEHSRSTSSVSERAAVSSSTLARSSLCWPSWVSSSADGRVPDEDCRVADLGLGGPRM